MGYTTVNNSVPISRSLMELQDAADRIFDAILSRVRTEKAQLKSLSTRLLDAQARVDALSGTKRAITTYSSAKYPRGNQDTMDFVPLFDDTGDAGARTVTLDTGQGENEEEGTLELFQFFSETNHEYWQKDYRKKEKYFPKLKSVADTYLFNWTERPYHEYRFADNLVRAERSLDSNEVHPKPIDLPPPPESLRADDSLPQPGAEEFGFRPVLRQVPGFSLPAVLPDLPMVAEINWEGTDQLPSIAPSAIQGGLSSPRSSSSPRLHNRPAPLRFDASPSARSDLTSQWTRADSSSGSTRANSSATTTRLNSQAALPRLDSTSATSRLNVQKGSGSIHGEESFRTSVGATTTTPQEARTRLLSKGKGSASSSSSSRSSSSGSNRPSSLPPKNLFIATGGVQAPPPLSRPLSPPPPPPPPPPLVPTPPRPPPPPPSLPPVQSGHAKGGGHSNLAGSPLPPVDSQRAALMASIRNTGLDFLRKTPRKASSGAELENVQSPPTLGVGAVDAPKKQSSPDEKQPLSVMAEMARSLTLRRLSMRGASTPRSPLPGRLDSNIAPPTDEDQQVTDSQDIRPTRSTLQAQVEVEVEEESEASDDEWE